MDNFAIVKSVTSKTSWTLSLTAVQLPLFLTAVQLMAWMQNTNLIFLLDSCGKITTTKSITHNLKFGGLNFYNLSTKNDLEQKETVDKYHFNLSKPNSHQQQPFQDLVTENSMFLKLFYVFP